MVASHGTRPQYASCAKILDVFCQTLDATSRQSFSTLPGIRSHVNSYRRPVPTGTKASTTAAATKP